MPRPAWVAQLIIPIDPSSSDKSVASPQGEGLFPLAETSSQSSKAPCWWNPPAVHRSLYALYQGATGVVPRVRHEWCLQDLGPALQNRQFAAMTAMTPEQQLSTFNASGARALDHAASQAAMEIDLEILEGWNVIFQVMLRSLEIYQE